jgi:[acyl-carrier-protein] S-malonyltransferase
MRPAAEKLAAKLASVTMTAPAIPVLHNVDVMERATPNAIRSALAQQAAGAVRWVETIQAFAARGITHVVECGPGRVLTGLNKRIVRELKSHALTDGADIDAAKAALAGE